MILHANWLEYSKGLYFSILGKWILNNGENPSYLVCAKCGKKFNVTPTQKYSGGGGEVVITTTDCSPVCKECSTNTKKCVGCGLAAFPEDGEVGGNNTFACRQCIDFNYVQKCAECGAYGRNFRRVRQEWFCETCYRSAFSQCQNCGNSVRTSYLQGGRCDRCRSRELLLNYSYRIPPLFLGLPSQEQIEFERSKWYSNYSFEEFRNLLVNSTVFLGVELELESKQGGKHRDLYKVLKELHTRFNTGEVITKSDSSIHHGCELVTTAATLEAHRKLWERFFSPVIPELEGRSNCGLHIHISRAPLTDLQIGKMSAFVNAQSNQQFICDVAGRRSSYAEFYHQRDFRFYGDYRKKAEVANALKAWEENSKSFGMKKKPYSQANLGGPSHYDALNLANAHTLELRIFKSTTDKEFLFAALCFADALVRYTVPSAVSLKEVTQVSKFCEFVQANRKVYPELLRRLVHLKYVKEPERKAKPERGE